MANPEKVTIVYQIIRLNEASSFFSLIDTEASVCTLIFCTKLLEEVIKSQETQDPLF